MSSFIKNYFFINGQPKSCNTKSSITRGLAKLDPTSLHTFFFLASCAIVLCTSVLSLNVQAKTLLDRVAVIVNDQSILESDIQSRLLQLESQIKSRGANMPPRNVIMPQLIDRMVLESIQDQMADRFQIQVADQEVNEAIARIAQSQDLSFDQYIQQLKDSSQSIESLRAQLKRELTHYQLQQRMLASRIQITEQEVETFLNSKEALENQNIEYKIRHILLQLSERAPPKEVQAREEQAKAIIESIKNKTNTFEQSALAVSNDGFALKGGDMGWRRISQIPARFVQNLLTMQTGDISKPIRSPSGFHIIYLENKRGEDTVMVERAKIEHILIKPNQIRSEEQAEQFAIDLREHILDGKTLAELARTFSDDPGSALNGGDLGWVSLDSLDKTFAETARELPIDELSDVFRSQFGYHLLRVTDRREEDMTQALRLNRAQRWLQQREFEEYLPVWLGEIRADAYVELKPPFDQFKEIQR